MDSINANFKCQHISGGACRKWEKWKIPVSFPHDPHQNFVVSGSALTLQKGRIGNNIEDNTPLSVELALIEGNK